MRIKTKGAQAFNVPNDSEGQEFCRLMDKFINRTGWHYRRRGRGSRKLHGTQDSIPTQYSEWMAVYLGDDKQRVRHSVVPHPMPAPIFQAPVPEDEVFLTAQEIECIRTALEFSTIDGDEQMAAALGVHHEEVGAVLNGIHQKLID